VDLIPAYSVYPWDAPGVRIPLLPAIKPSEGPAQEVIAIESLTLEQYHKICYWNLSRPRNLYWSTSVTVNLNAIIVCCSGDQLEEMVEIALLPDAEIFLDDWTTAARATREVTEDGWTWYYDFILAVW
jgi:hypothetical protein